MGTAMLTIMAAFAQLERDTMIERTRAGLIAAAAMVAEADARARSTTPTPSRRAACVTRASRQLTSRRC
jgi:DNA invertase Pin-like site-specific DNA recombinase